jgi:hypothetical protein
MTDYTWPSVYFAYLFFTISLVLAVFFFIRSLKDGYWKKESENIKYQVFENSWQAKAPAPQGERVNHGTDQRKA